MNLTIQAMASMITGQLLAGWRTDKASLVVLLTRAGFNSTEIIEHLDDAMVAAGVIGIDPMQKAVDDYVEQTAAFDQQANEDLTNEQMDALAIATYVPAHELLEAGATTPTSLRGAAAAVCLADRLSVADCSYVPLITSAARYLGGLRQALDEAMIDTIELQRDQAYEVRT